VDSRDAARPIASGTSHVFPSSVSPDGRIAVTTVTHSGHIAVAIVPPGGGAPQMVESGPFNEAAPAISPDGKWLALESDESGRTEIVARPLEGGRRIAVSTGGGSRPRWSADGRSIYFASGGKVIRAVIDPATHAIRARETLLDRPGAQVLAITPAGRALVSERQPGAGRALVVLQWLRELRQRLPLPVTAPR
jgi:Tol biopolymer transport system component